MSYLFVFLILLGIAFFAVRSQREDYPAINQWRRAMQGLRPKRKY